MAVITGSLLPAALLGGLVLGLLLLLLNQITLLLGRLRGPRRRALSAALVVGVSLLPAMHLLVAILARGRKAAALLIGLIAACKMKFLRVGFMSLVTGPAMIAVTLKLLDSQGVRLSLSHPGSAQELALLVAITAGGAALLRMNF